MSKFQFGGCGGAGIQRRIATLSAVCLSLLLSCAAVLPSAAVADELEFTTLPSEVFGQAGSGNGQFNVPAAIAGDSAGNVWVADTTNNRIQKFGPKGEYLSKFGALGSGNGQLKAPEGIAIDSTGNVWVADTGNNRIQKFGPNGEYLTQCGSKGSADGQFEGPKGIEFDSLGNLWVTDTVNSRIQEISSACKYVAKFGTGGTLPGQLALPVDIGIDPQNNIWVAEAFGFRIQKFNAKGEFLATVGSSGSGPGQLNGPSGVVVDSEGDIWVSEAGNDRIQKFNSAGKVRGTFGKDGSAIGQFKDPRSLVDVPEGDIWVADTGNNRLQRAILPALTKLPGARTEPAAVINSTSAVLKGVVRPKGLATTYQFEYGTTTAYGSKAPTSPASAGSVVGEVEVAKTVSTLQTQTTYHYRLVATNVEGVTYGSDQTFTTRHPAEPYWKNLKTGETLDHEVTLGLSGTLSIPIQESSGVKCPVTASMVLYPGYQGVLSPFTFTTGKCEPFGELKAACTIQSTESSPPFSLQANKSNIAIGNLSFRWVFAKSFECAQGEWVVTGVEPKLTPVPAFTQGAITSVTPAGTIKVVSSAGTSTVSMTGQLELDAASKGVYGLAWTKVLPKATTESASSITATQATLNGTVNPEASDTTYYFEYGPTTAYGTKIPATAASVGSGTSNVAVAQTPKGLTEGTTYHYRLVAINEAGTKLGSDVAFETVDLPNTLITSSQPSYTSHETPLIAFTSDEAGSTFKCSLDNPEEKATTTCTSPYSLPSASELGPGWHTFVVQATDKDGNLDPTPAKWKLNTDIYPAALPSSKLVSPEEGRKTASYYTLKSEWGAAPEGGGVSSVSYQLKLSSWPAFKDIPTQYLRDAEDKQAGWAVAVSGDPGKSPPLFFNVKAYAEAQGWGPIVEGLQLRAIFNGGQKAAGASIPVTTTYSRFAGGLGDATAQVGPANVDLATGAFTITRTDVSIPVPGSDSNLEFTRTYNSAYGANEKTNSKTLGAMWQPAAPVESEYESEAWQKLLVRHEDPVAAKYDPVCEEEIEEFEEGTKDDCLEEYAIPEANWVEVLDNEGASIPFDRVGTEPYTYVAPEEAKDFSLSKPGANFILADSRGTRTEFTRNETTNEYQPSAISFQGTSKEARIVYEVSEGKKRVERIIAPSSVTCNPFFGEGNWTLETLGCRTLEFGYFSSGHLYQITYFNAARSSQSVAIYEYNSENGNLKAVLDPRTGLKETYQFQSAGAKRLTSLTPAGMEPWNFKYYGEPSETYEAKLKSVSRATLLESPSTATTTIAYNVPVSGSSAPYDMSAATIAKWGQSDYPVNATAIFPPTEVPSEPPSAYTEATVHYLDPDGYEVNTASPAPPGVSGSSITTSEVDTKGNVVRTLSAQNRLAALEAANTVTRSQELDSHSTYNAEGTQMLESWGPLHKVRLESGKTEEARQHTAIKYDEGFGNPKNGEAMPNLPTKETTTAAIPGKEDVEPRVTETKYNWTLRAPTEVIADPSPGLNLRTVIAYDSTTGQVTEARLPSNPEGGGAGTAKTVYYSAQEQSPQSACRNQPVLAGLPCVKFPAAAPSPAGSNPQTPWTWFTKYSSLDKPTEIQEKTNGVLKRTTTITYDSAGRPIKSKQTGEGTSVPTVETTYSTETGAAVGQHFVCEAPESCSGFDTQALTTTYDKLGRPTRYEDADGGVSEFAYDVMGRPALISDGKGTQAITYDEKSGLPTKLVDSAAGTFTAAYNADGAMIEQVLPDGLAAQTTYDPEGSAVSLRYQKISNCSSNCTWLQFSQERSIRGQVMTQTGTLASQEYSYDKAGRLTLAKETPTGEGCTTRSYVYDKDSNRTSLTSRAPGAGGVCDTTSAGTKKSYTYDSADRLTGEGTAYDSLGRVISLPATYAGGSTLATGYYVNNMTQVQIQSGVTNTYELDAAFRERKRTQSGGASGTEVYHYASGSDSPTWIDEGSSKWSRSIGALGGGLGAIQKSSGETTLQLANLHGDIVATAALSPSETKLLSTQQFDEFGTPKQTSGAKYGWLGGNGRRTELASGVVQMGVRSYVPSLGRFLSPDPVAGGSANAYDYGNGDPVNQFDLGGEKPASEDGGSNCHAKLHVYSFKKKRRMHASLRVFCGGGKAVVITLRKVHISYEKAQSGCFPHHFCEGQYCHMESDCQDSTLTESNIKTPRQWKSEQSLSCEPGKEYQVTVTITYQVDSIFVIGSGKQGNGQPGAAGGGHTESLFVQAQQYCGHSIRGQT
jgi:RHS repeat-associated protein